jgi:hypothetical protein
MWELEEATSTMVEYFPLFKELEGCIVDATSPRLTATLRNSSSFSVDRLAHHSTQGKKRSSSNSERRLRQVGRAMFQVSKIIGGGTKQ